MNNAYFCIFYDPSTGRISQMNLESWSGVMVAEMQAVKLGLQFMLIGGGDSYARAS